MFHDVRPPRGDPTAAGKSQSRERTEQQYRPSAASWEPTRLAFVQDLWSRRLDRRGVGDGVQREASEVSNLPSRLKLSQNSQNAKKRLIFMVKKGELLTKFLAR